MTSVVYARISQDSAGLGLGVERQVRACQELAQREGLDVTHVYVDNDVSAFSGRRRPEYERLLQDIETGLVTKVLAWHPDRLHRSPKELEGFIDLLERTGCGVVTVQAGHWDLTTPSGRMVARQLGAVARYESELKSERVKAKLAQHREAGHTHGGSRPYGWQQDRRTLHAAEAEHLRHAARLVISGHSMKAVVRALNEAGARNSQGGPWRDVTLRSTLLRPRNVGDVVARGRVLEGVQGDWEPLLDRDTWDQMRTLLTDPSRRTTPGRNGRSRLLSGVAKCGACGGPMRGSKDVYKGQARLTYRCQLNQCTIRDGEHVDAMVREYVLARLHQPDARELLYDDSRDVTISRARAEVEMLQQRLAVAAADYADGSLTAGEWRVVRERITPQLEAAAKRSVPRGTSARLLAPLVEAPDVAVAWDALDLSVRRQVVALLLDIAIDKIPEQERGGPRFIPDFVRISYRGETAPTAA